MKFLGLQTDPERFSTANELHARPFPSIDSSGYAVCLALRNPGAQTVDAVASAATLARLLDRYGAAHPPEGANHHYAQIGRFRLKWERHTEFETYTLFSDQPLEKPFLLSEPPLPLEWAQSVESQLLTAALVQIERLPKGASLSEGVSEFSAQHFVPESACISFVSDRSAVVASDFSIDETGFVRMLIRASAEMGPQRLGRITQRLLEIETYKAMSLLTLPIARQVSGELANVDRKLAQVVAGFARPGETDSERFDTLVAISAEIEDISARVDNRFSAARAYSAIVGRRIEVLREERLDARQTIGEFMMRRFEPAMRTCESTASRLSGTAARATRAAQLLRTRADVAREEQNQEIMERMDSRAALQLKLQKTVEGLSVVAISYYAVNLAAYALSPFGKFIGLDKTSLTAALVLPVLIGVWLIVRRIRKSL